MKISKSVIKAILCGCVVFLLITQHRKIGNEIKNAMRLWSGMLIPSLFPYLVLSQYITNSGVLDIFYPVKKFVHKIFNVSEKSANVFLCSLISGYPSGAMCTAQLYSMRIIEKEEAERLVCFTNNAGPMFVISVVGSSFMGSSGDGLALYVIQTLSAMIAGIALGKKANKVSFRPSLFESNTSNIFWCTQNAINTILMIGALLLLATVVAEIGIIIFEALPFTESVRIPYVKAFIYYFLEISNGVKALTDFGNSKLVFAFISSAISWSGVCVIMQIKSVLPGEFKITKIIKWKIFQSILSFLFGLVYKSYFSFNINFETKEIFVLSLVASIIIFGVYITGGKKKKLPSAQGIR